MPKRDREKDLCGLLQERETPHHHVARPEQHLVQQRLEEVIDAAIQYADACEFLVQDKRVAQEFRDPLSDFNKLVAKIEEWVVKVDNMAMFNAQSGVILDQIKTRLKSYRGARFYRTKEVPLFCKYVGGKLEQWVACVDPAKGALLEKVNWYGVPAVDTGGTGNPYCVRINLIH